jgi:hypothetical protein
MATCRVKRMMSKVNEPRAMAKIVWAVVTEATLAKSRAGWELLGLQCHGSEDA